VLYRRGAEVDGEPVRREEVGGQLLPVHRHRDLRVLDARVDDQVNHAGVLGLLLVLVAARQRELCVRRGVDGDEE
jgi:hypothetical protein